MLIPYSELPPGAFYVVLTEDEPKLRRKGGSASGHAYSLVWGDVPRSHLHLCPDESDRLEDSSLMVQQVFLN